MWAPLANNGVGNTIADVGGSQAQFSDETVASDTNGMANDEKDKKKVNPLDFCGNTRRMMICLKPKLQMKLI